jgi:putative tricarboxylic transport membrane protein
MPEDFSDGPGLIASIALAQGSLLNALGMVVLGPLLGLVGTDVTSGTQRFTFGASALSDAAIRGRRRRGFRYRRNRAGTLKRRGHAALLVQAISGFAPNREERRRIIAPILRGTGLGSPVGILPGGGALLASFAAYALEKRLSPRALEFGTGAIESVAAPEAANNAGAQTSVIPLLTLGIPSNPMMALMIGAMIIRGTRPQGDARIGFAVLGRDRLHVDWQAVFIALDVPADWLVCAFSASPQPVISQLLMFAAVGVLSLSSSAVAVCLLALFGVLGYAFSCSAVSRRFCWWAIC